MLPGQEYFEEVLMAKKKVLFFYPRFVEEYKALLEKNVPEAEFMICTNREEMEKYAPEAEIALVGMTFPQDVFKRMPRLEWVQALAAGVESYMQNAEQFKHIPVCRITGAFGKYMAEYVLAYVLYFCQNIPRVLKAQREKKWDSFRMEFIHQKTLGVMGLGHVGKAVAQKGRDAGMRVVSWDMARADAPFVERQFGSQEMSGFLKGGGFCRSYAAGDPGNEEPGRPRLLQGHEENRLPDQHLPGGHCGRGRPGGSADVRSNSGCGHRCDERRAPSQGKPVVGLSQPDCHIPYLRAQSAGGHG